MKKQIIYIVFTIVLMGCKGETLPKPSPYLKLEYPKATYQEINSDCPYNFEISDLASIYFKDNCWASITYPTLKATLYITYRPVENNLNEILKEVEKMTFEHTVKATTIDVTPYENYRKRVFAKLYNIEGNVASNIQFSATDSIKHVLSGALYFYVKPNYDSILPAIKYLEKDVKHLVETIEWKQ